LQFRKERVEKRGQKNGNKAGPLKSQSKKRKDSWSPHTAMGGGEQGDIRPQRFKAEEAKRFPVATAFKGRVGCFVGQRMGKAGALVIHKQLKGRGDGERECHL